MREKIGPWLPAIFCAALALIVTVGNVWASATDCGMNIVFIMNMPTCFFFVGSYLTKLKNDNRELRDRLDAMDSPISSTSV